MLKNRIAAPAMLLAGFLISPIAFSATDAEVEALEKRIKALEASNSANADRMNGIIEENEKLSIHGFISAGVTTANTSGGTSLSQGEAASGDASDGNTDNQHYQKDTKVGLQFGYQLSEETDMMVQMIGRGDNNNYEARMEWAYLGHVFLENKGPLEQFKIRAGKAPVATYLISEYYNIGVAYPWVEPPFESYSVVGGASMTGFDFQADWTLPADWSLNTQFYVGEADVEPTFGEGDAQDFRDIWGYNLSLTKDAWTFRAGSANTKVALDSVLPFVVDPDTGALVSAAIAFETAPLEADGPESDYLTAVTALNEFDQGYQDLSAGLALVGFNVPYTSAPLSTSNIVPASFNGVGVSYDDGTWLMYAEMTQLDIDIVQPSTDAGYITLGYHHGDYTPYIGYSYYEHASDASDAAAYLQAQEDFAAALAANPAILPTLDGALAGSLIDQDTYDSLTGGIALATGDATAEGASTLAALKVRLLEVKPQETYTLGLRYDFTPGATVKLELQNVTGLEGNFTEANGTVVEDIYITKLAVQAAF